VQLLPLLYFSGHVEKFDVSHLKPQARRTSPNWPEEVLEGLLNDEEEGEKEEQHVTRIGGFGSTGKPLYTLCPAACESKL
jgi:hypothetical protein